MKRIGKTKINKKRYRDIRGGKETPWKRTHLLFFDLGRKKHPVHQTDYRHQVTRHPCTWSRGTHHVICTFHSHWSLLHHDTTVPNTRSSLYSYNPHPYLHHCESIPVYRCVRWSRNLFWVSLEQTAGSKHIFLFLLLLHQEAAQLSRYKNQATGWTTDESGFDSRLGKEVFLFSTPASYAAGT
jgi:hypothetical protein